MNAEERKRRNSDVMRLHLAGATYQQIADTVGLKSVSSVHRIVQLELAGGALRRAGLADTALYQERAERLFQAHWGAALRGDHRSAEICYRILEQQLRVSRLDACGDVASVAGDDPEDELASHRKRYARKDA